MNENLDEREVGERIRRAGPRPEIPPEDLRAIREAARAAWHRSTARRRTRRYGFLAALAAGLVLVVLAGRVWLGDRAVPAPLRAVGSIELATGSARAVSPSGDEAAAAVGQTLSAGMRLATGTGGRLSLRSTAGRSIRLDGETTVVLSSDSELELIEGAVYVDSGPSGSPVHRLAIRTAFGIMREIGTQFEVRKAAGGGPVRVRVREGRVSVDRDGVSHEASRGEQLTLAADGSVERAAVDPVGAEWDWVVGAAPALDIEGRTLAVYLEWVARETGWEVVYADPEIAREAGGIVLHGTIDDLRPDESVEVVVPGSGLLFDVEGRTLSIRRP